MFHCIAENGKNSKLLLQIFSMWANVSFLEKDITLSRFNNTSQFHLITRYFSLRACPWNIILLPLHITVCFVYKYFWWVLLVNNKRSRSFCFYVKTILNLSLLWLFTNILVCMQNLLHASGLMYSDCFVEFIYMWCSNWHSSIVSL